MAAPAGGIQIGYGEGSQDCIEGARDSNSSGDAPVILRRTLAICAAVLLVAAFALATLEPPDMPLGSLLYSLDAGFLNLLQGEIQRHLPSWLWGRVVVPVLIRPAWLLPAAGGILCAGGAASLAMAGNARSSRRWRS